ncbi:MAG: diheme cytochrome c [Burkholderiales bacterium]
MKTLIALILAAFAASAVADGGYRLSAPDHPKWKAECGSCHLAYPAQFLTADNWRRLMGGLDRHFGVNATLTPQENTEILAYLERYSARASSHGAKTLRISDTPWFQREHRGITNTIWSQKFVNSRSNCMACHTAADRGNWSEDSIRLPGGRRWRDDD